MSDYNFGLNLVTLLNSLAILDDHEIDSNQVEVEVVEEDGQEGFATVEIQSLAKDAADTITTLQHKLDAMAAENAALKSAFHPENLPEEAVDAVNSTAQFDWDSNDCGSWTWVVNDDDVAKAVICAMTPPQTPATDAYMNSVRAEGVDMVAEAIGNSAAKLKAGSKDWKSLKSIVFTLVNFAAQLRSGTHDTADKAG